MYMYTVHVCTCTCTLYVYAPVLWQFDQVVVRDGRLSGSGGTHKHDGSLVGQIVLEEVHLNGCLASRDDQVAQLKAKKITHSEYFSLSFKSTKYRYIHDCTLYIDRCALKLIHNRQILQPWKIKL